MVTTNQYKTKKLTYKNYQEKVILNIFEQIYRRSYNNEMNLKHSDKK